MATFEYRKLFRADVVVTVEYKTLQEPILSGVACTKNLSQTGLSLIMPDKLAKDRKIELEIHIGGDNPIHVEAIILWQNPCNVTSKKGLTYYLTGLQIIDMAPDDAIRESDFVRDFLVEKSEELNIEIIKKLEELDS